jgi:hypothetical protein
MDHDLRAVVAYPQSYAARIAPGACGIRPRGTTVQTVHGNRQDDTVMLALRCDEDGIWLVCCEAAIV